MAPKAPFDRFFLEHLFQAGTEEFLAAVEEKPGCEQFVAECGYIQHALRCDTAKTAKQTGAFIARVFSGKPKLSAKRCEGLLLALVRAEHLAPKVRVSLITTALELGADPHLVVRSGPPPAMSAHAAAKGEPKVLALFSAAPTAKTLEEAIDADDADAVTKLLAEHDASPEDSKLLVSAIRNERAVVTLLIERGLGLKHQKGTTSALHAAASRGDKDLVAALLERGQDPDLIDPTDRDLTPLQHAAMFARHHPEAFELLLDRSKVTAADLAGKQWEWLWHTFGATTITGLMGRFGATLASEGAGLNLLHLAAADGNAALVTTLVSQGADRTARTKKSLLLGGVKMAKGATPAAVAKALNKAAVLQALGA